MHTLIIENVGVPGAHGHHWCAVDIHLLLNMVVMKNWDLRDREEQWLERALVAYIMTL